jgi:hypothetical protein
LHQTRIRHTVPKIPVIPSKKMYLPSTTTRSTYFVRAAAKEIGSSQLLFSVSLASTEDQVDPA